MFLGFPGGSDGKESCLQCGTPEFDPSVEKMPFYHVQNTLNLGETKNCYGEKKKKEKNT